MKRAQSSYTSSTEKIKLLFIRVPLLIYQSLHPLLHPLNLELFHPKFYSIFDNSNYL